MPASPDARLMDMHMHSSYSDAQGNTLEVITETLRAKRMGGCICDHNEIRGSLELFEKNQVCTIPSIEIGSEERLEFLLYFQDPSDLEAFYVRHVEPFKKTRYFAKLDRSFTILIPAAKEHNGVVALPHPYSNTWKNINYGRSRKVKLFSPEIFSKIDMIEVINGHLRHKQNFKAFLLAEMFEKAAVAGSDSHLPQTIGSVYCRFDQALGYKDILEIFSKGIRVGMNQTLQGKHTARTGADMVSSHLKLFVSKKDQKRWMVKYEATG